MALPPFLLERTHKAILKYFERDELRRIVRACLSLSFDVLTPDKTLDDQVDELLVRVERTGNLLQLLQCLAAARPDDGEAGQVLAALHAEVLAAYGDHVPTPRPIAGAGPGRCDFYRHVDLPATYVPRPEVLAEIKGVLLAPAADGAATALTSAIKMDALQGMGGIGKSVIARALCDDPDVQDAFPGGILWATLGQAPNLVERLREWVEKLGGTVRSTAPTADMLKAELQAALEGRSCLLILDDVWNKGDVGYFRPPGGSRLLLTTRDAALAEDLGASRAADPGDGQGGGTGPAGAFDRRGARPPRCGGTSSGRQAAGLSAAGHHARRPPATRHGGGQWLAEFDAYELELQRPQSEHDSLAWTFDRSLRDLPEQKRRLYAALAIFPEDEPLHPGAVARLWAGLAGLSDKQSGRLLHELVDRALVQQRRAQGRGAGAEGQLVLHDLVRDFIERELGAEGLTCGACRHSEGLSRQCAAGQAVAGRRRVFVRPPGISPGATGEDRPDLPGRAGGPVCGPGVDAPAVRSIALHLRRLPGGPGPLLAVAAPGSGHGNLPGWRRGVGVGRQRALRLDPLLDCVAGRELRAGICGASC